MTSRRGKAGKYKGEYSRSRSGPPVPRQIKRLGLKTNFYNNTQESKAAMDINHDIIKLDPAHLAPPRGQLDESCAGIPLDSWRRGDPLESVETAVRFVAEHPDTQTMAYCHDISREEWDQHDRRQRAAGRAWAAREFPHLNIRLRVITLPYRGIGNDVHVMFAEVVKPKKVTP